MFAGSFAAMVPLAIVGIGVLSFLRIPEHAVLLDQRSKSLRARSGEIVAPAAFVTALVCAVGSYALMTFMMTGAPLAMVGCGFSTDRPPSGSSGT